MNAGGQRRLLVAACCTALLLPHGGDAAAFTFGGPNATLVVSPVSSNIGAPGTTTHFSVALGSVPSDAVTVTPVSANSAEVVVAGNLVFGPGDWNVTQNVTVTSGTAFDHEYNDRLRTETGVALETSSLGDVDYHCLHIDDVIITNTWAPSEAIVVSASELNVSSGSQTFTIGLNSTPSADVTIDLVYTDTEVSVSPAQAIFSSGDAAAKTITVAAISDDVASGSALYTVSTAPSISSDAAFHNQDGGDVRVAFTDAVTSGASITLSATTLSDDDGTAQTIDVVLNSEPEANVTVIATASEPGQLTLDASALIFGAGNWSVTQQLSMAAVVENVADGNASVDITLVGTSDDSAYTFTTTKTVTVADAAAAPEVIMSPDFSSIQLREDDTPQALSVQLTTVPTSAVRVSFAVVGVSPSNPDNLVFDPSVLEFTDANAKTTTVRVADAVAEDPTSAVGVAVRVESDDALYNSQYTVTYTIVDNDTAGLDVDTSAGTDVVEGGGLAPPSHTTATLIADTKPVELKISSRPIADVVVAVSSSDVSEGVVSPAAVTFTPANYTAVATVTVAAVDDGDRVNDEAFAVLFNASSDDTTYEGLSHHVQFNNVDSLCDHLTITSDASDALDETGSYKLSIGLSYNSTELGGGSVAVSSIAVAGGNNEATADKASLTLVDETAENVTITLQDDSIEEGDTYSQWVTLTSSGLVCHVRTAVVDVQMGAIQLNTPINVAESTGVGVLETQLHVTLTHPGRDDVVVNLAAVPADEVELSATSLTFAPGAYNSPQTVTVTGVDDEDFDGDTAVSLGVSGAASGDYAQISATRSIQNLDDDAPIRVGNLQGVLNEDGGRGMLTVELLLEPSAAVTVSMSSNDTGEASLAVADVVFAPAAWTQVKTLWIDGEDDFVVDGDQRVEIAIGVNSTDAAFQGKATPTRYAENRDNDVAALLVGFPDQRVTFENGTGFNVTVRLGSEPGAAVVVHIGSDAPTEVSVGSPASLTFEADNSNGKLWSSAVTVSLSGVDDEVVDGDASATIEVLVDSTADPLYADLARITAVAVNRDDDSEGFTVSPVGPHELRECGSVNLSAVLLSEPAGTVEMTVACNDTSEAMVTPEVLTFGAGNWSDAQVITVHGVDDDVQDENTSFHITFSCAGSADALYSQLPSQTHDWVGLNDADTAGITVDPSVVVFDERPTDVNVTVVLTSQPLANVVVNFTSNDTTEGYVEGAVLTFTPGDWNVAQTMLVGSVNDWLADADVAFTLSGTIASDDAGFAALMPYVEVTNVHRHTEYDFTVLPRSFVEGQELRLRVKTFHTGENGTVSEVEYIAGGNVSMELRTYAYDGSLGTDCEGYAVSGTVPLFETTDFGVASNATRVGAAYATFPAAPAGASFVICFKHTMPHEREYIHSEANNQWQAAEVNGSSVWTAEAADLWYRLPDPSAGQYAVVELLANESWGFTYARSACATDPANCAAADNVKIVPAGTPCTYEYATFGADYYGSASVGADGAWSGAAVTGLSEGATAGGVGAFGTQYANPFVEEWTGDGDYAAANNVTEFENHTVAPPQGYLYDPAKRAYVYVRLPEAVGDFDVCFSSARQREMLRNGTYDYSIPMWRKAFPCGIEPYAASGNCSGGATPAPHFRTVAEPVGWSLVDVTPLTWGTIVFDDSAGGQLSTQPANATFPVAPATAGAAPAAGGTERNYWGPQGGDYFRIVPASAFGEATSEGRVGQHAQAARLGSPASVGCWTTGLGLGDGRTGGWAEDMAVYPVGSWDLTSDPSAASPGGDDASGVAAAYSSLFLPAAGTEWRVCYRRTCNFDGAACARHSGLRVLPFHMSSAGAPPPHWLHLEAAYNHTSLLVPGTPAGVTPPPNVTWFANDTRAGSHGPVVVEQVDNTSAPYLDARAWNFNRNYAAGDAVAATTGAVLRLVNASLPCSVAADHAGIAAASSDAGLLECNNAAAGTDTFMCAGEASDATATHVAHYITVPATVGVGYTVCYRHGGWNWREIVATPAGAAWLPNGTAVPSSVLERDGWAPPGDGLYTPTAAAGITVTAGNVYSGAEVLFEVHDPNASLTLAPRAECAGGCSSSGDVLRFVPRAASCSIVATSYQPSSTDTYLNMHCANATGSGMTAAPCDASDWAVAFCGAGGCSADSSDAFATFVATTPAVYDDVVPGRQRAAGLTRAVASLVLPDAEGMYKACYKQAALSNWLSFEMDLTAGVVTDITPPPRSAPLMGGTAQRFTLALEAGVNATQDVVSVLTKFVAYDASDPAASCLVPAAAVGDTTEHFVATSDSAIDVMLVVPQHAGEYSLCVHAVTADGRGNLSWWRPAPAAGGASYEVVDNAVRWFVYPEWSPVNSGMARVGFMRCAFEAGACNAASGSEVFDTDPGSDAAKLIDATSSCSDGSGEAFGLGASLHVGIESGLYNTSAVDGVTNLGPADGLSDVAELTTTLPPTADDAGRLYKVCVKTAMVGAQQGPAAWMEVVQAEHLATQQVLRLSDGTSGFVTGPGLLYNWTVSDGLAPNSSLYRGVPDGDVALAGASTLLVGNPFEAAAPTAGYGFVLNAHAPLTEALAGNTTVYDFKLVAARRPFGRLPVDQRDPEDWGDVATWEWDGTVVDCLGAGWEATATQDCSLSDRSECPRAAGFAAGDTAVNAVFHMPLAPGEYYVCVRVDRNGTVSPWQQLRSHTGGYGVFSHPAFLEVEVDGRMEAAQVAVIDSRLASAAWCGRENATVDCTQQAFTADLFAVVGSSQMCPTPTAAPAGSAAGAPEWFPLMQATDITVVVNDTHAGTAFTLPPTHFVSPSGLYKLCVYKAGSVQDPNVTTAAVSKAGVVYQLYNRGGPETGGPGAFWQDLQGLYATKLSVTSPLEYNETVRFMEFTPDLEGRFGAGKVPDELVTDPVTGKISNTPLLRSGATVAYQVEVTTADGIRVPTRPYAVDVIRCRKAAFWSELECLQNAQETPDSDPGPFHVLSIGSACEGGAAKQYGWFESGLRQFSIGGTVTFALQYRSACPPGVFGCGVRFKASSRGANTLWSSSQWVNVAEHAPDSVSIDGYLQTPHHAGSAQDSSGCEETASLCYKKRCVNGRECVVALQARYLGPIEYAPLHPLSMRFSAGDYEASPLGTPEEVRVALGGSVGADPLISEAKWRLGGDYSYTFIPRLQNGADEAEVFLNVTYGDPAALKWTRFVIHVARETPTALRLDALTPLDVAHGLTGGGTRSPAPAVRTTSPTPDHLHAAEASYLEALVPYRLEYTPLRDVDGAPTPLPVGIGAMTGYRVSASIPRSAANIVLRPSEDAAAAFVTSPAALGAPLDVTVDEDDAAFSIAFRVYVTDSHCSRFSAGGGCDVEFRFEKAGFATLVGKVTAPVRVPAATLRVVPAYTKATVREGIEVAVLPGTYVRQAGGGTVFINDDFHLGDVFALLGGPEPTDGYTNRDGLTMVPEEAAAGMSCMDDDCKLVGYAPAEVSSALVSGWGAVWTLRPSKPCFQCPLTFHTTWGAGPQSYDATQGATTLTWTQDNVALQCPTAEPLPFIVGTAGTPPFDVDVLAGVAGSPGLSAVYPRWMVFLDADQNATDADLVHTAGLYGAEYKLVRDGGGAEGALLTAWMGDGAVAKFEGLRFTGENAPADRAPEGFRATFHTVAHEYASEEPGSSKATGQRLLECAARFEVYRFDPLPPTPAPITFDTELRVVKVDGATSLCDEGRTDCADWEGATDQVALDGLSFTVEFVNVSSDGAENVDTTTKRNVTIVPLGGPHSRPYGAHPTWTYKNATGQFTSAPVALDSEFNVDPLEVYDGEEYSFGTLRMVATRSLQQVAGRAVVGTDGRGAVSLRYDNATASPVRQAVFALCEAVWDGWKEVVTERCLRINLWLAPPEVERRAAVITHHPVDAPLVLGNGASCGAGLANITVASYFSTGFSDLPRFYVYDTLIEYNVSLPGQAFTIPGSKQQAPYLIARNAVNATAPKTHNVTDGLKVTFEFYGSNPVAAPTPVTVAARGVAAGRGRDLEVLGTRTAGAYQWLPPDEAIVTWSVDSEVSRDDECPTKRYLMTTEGNYRAYAADGVPAAGWGYNRTHAAAVGIPFPIQTTVLTNASGRASSFPESFVKVTKRSAVGCNDGGYMSVYKLRASQAGDTRVQVPGALAEGWELSEGGLYTNKGVAIPWMVFTEECQACTLQLQLCYIGRTAETCMDDLFEAERTLELPQYPDRMKHTKPFRVLQPRMDTVQVVAQALPNATHRGTDSGGNVPVTVGDAFAVQFEGVQHFGRWAMTAPNGGAADSIAVHVRAVWRYSAAGKYGNGGFFVDGYERWAAGKAVAGGDASCAGPLSKDEFRAAATRPPLRLDDGWGRFFFARPCDACEVWFDYTLSSDRGAVSASFPVREYDGSAPGGVVAFTVGTCGAGWLLAGVPPVAVRRRHQFSLTAVEVDAHDLLASVHTGAVARLKQLKGEGNSEGGVLVVSSPVLSKGADRSYHLPAANGCATVRAAYPWACYRCHLELAGVKHSLTVLTDATMIVAVPAAPRDFQPRWRHGREQAEAWSFEVYAADEMGARAYTVGGPTPAAFIPRYAHPHAGMGKPAKLTVLEGKAEMYTLIGAQNEALVVEVPAPSFKVADGGDVLNGIPVPVEAGVGVATVETSTSGLGAAVEFGFEGMDALPTTFAFMKHPPTVTYSLVPTHIALSVGQKDSAMGPEEPICYETGMAAALGPCAFSVLAVAKDPASAKWQFTSWSSPHAGEVATASVDCGECGAGEVVPKAAFKDGKAVFHLAAEVDDGKSCTCSVTVRPPPMLGNSTSPPYTFAVTYAPTVMAHWLWGSSENLMVSEETVSGSYQATSVANRSVELLLYAADAEEKRRVWDLAWSENQTVGIDEAEMTPPGCFVCTPPCRADTKESTSWFHLRGSFPAAGECLLRPGALKGLPTAAPRVTASPLRGLAVTAQVPAAVHAHMADPGSEGYLGGLGAATLDGTPAAVAGIGAWVTYTVVDRDGELVKGDSHMVFTMKATAGAKEVTVREVAAQGVATLHLYSADTTRTDACEGNYTKEDGCAHEPWRVSVQASSVDNNGTVHDFGTTDFGPVYFVRRTAWLEAHGPFGEPCKLGHDCLPVPQEAGRKELTEMWNAGWRPMSQGFREMADVGLPPYGRHATHHASWLAGVPFDMVVVAMDVSLAPVHHPEDVPPKAATFAPISTPCLNVDRSHNGTYLATTCFDGGACGSAPLAEIPACDESASGWAAPASIPLDGGFGVAEDVVYGAGGAPPGLQHFALSTPSHSKKESSVADPSQYLLEVNMQRVHTLRPTADDVECQAGVCEPVPGSDFLRRHTTLSPPRVHFFVALVDELDDTVTADSASSVSVRGRCESDPGVQLAYDNDGTLQYLTPPVFAAERGVAKAHSLTVSGDCARMLLEFTCIGEGSGCHGKTSALVLNNWTLPKVPGTPPPAPSRANELVASCLSLGALPDGAGIEDYVSSFDEGAFDDAMMAFLWAKQMTWVAGVSITHVCHLPPNQCTAELDDAACSFVGNVSDAEPSDSRGRGVALEEAQLFARFEMALLVELDAEQASAIIIEGIQQDLLLPPSESLLKASSPQLFSNADASGFSVSQPPPEPEPTPTPVTPEPYIQTPSPPSPAPGTAIPPTPMPVQRTQVPPPMFTEQPVPVIAGAAAAVPSVAGLLALVAATLLR